MAARESQTGPLHAVAERIVARYLSRGLTKDVQIISASPFHPGRGVDITCTMPDGVRRAMKVKADPYCGKDPGMIADRALPFYRADTGSFAFESVADASTKRPGWMLDSQADDLYYYYLALAQEEDEVSALLREPDDLLFSELRVECDDLIILPMAETRRWFEANAENYPPRPVFVGGAPSWHRLVPRADIQSRLPGARIVGSVFPALVR